MKKIPTFVILLSTAVIAVSAEKTTTWIDPNIAAEESPDFLIQGEYGENQESAAYGVQVVALGDGKFDAYILEGGLPGLGWTKEKARFHLSGERHDEAIIFPQTDKRSAKILNGNITITIGNKQTTLPKIERSSPTLNAKPPEGAVVLFDGTSADEWENGKLIDGLLAANNSLSKRTFNDCTIHLEFRTPYKPFASGQKRGNSGIYFGGRWETQILDSFGLEGSMNECGGIYSIAAPKINACLPPLTWQTYDFEFQAARFDENGSRISWPRITVKLNGVIIHDDIELPKNNTPSSPISTPLTPSGNPIFLQDHDNPVFFRNIWVVEK
jgi:hypothetical protein